MPDDTTYDITYGIDPKTGLVHAFQPWAWARLSWCRYYADTLGMQRMLRVSADATPTCLYCAIRGPR